MRVYFVMLNRVVFFVVVFSRKKMFLCSHEIFTYLCAYFIV